MELQSTTVDRDFYELVTYFTIIGINIVMMFFAYWLFDIASFMTKRARRLTTYSLGVLCAGVALWRTMAVVVYFDDFTVRLAVPVTAMLTWCVIFLIGYACHRYVLLIYRQSMIRRENIDLMEKVQKDIVEPLLRGEKVPASVIDSHKKASVDFAHKHLKA